jgi:hypothetical protein
MTILVIFIQLNAAGLTRAQPCAVRYRKYRQSSHRRLFITSQRAYNNLVFYRPEPLLASATILYISAARHGADTVAAGLPAEL